MFKWFMAKSIIVKIIIVTSSVVVIGGATAGAIIIPKVIEQQQQEQLERERQAQLEKEKEEDLANMSIAIKEEYREYGINLPLNLVTQGIQTVRYPEIEHAFGLDEKNKEELKNALIKELIEDYKGGELTVEEDINIGKRGDYPVKFILTSEKGNTKTETVTVTVWNYFRPNIYIDKTDITVTKGTEVNIMEGVEFDSNLPEEEQGHIETTGTVDINKVGTYTITYTYIPKDENEVPVSEKTRTYKVIEPLQIQKNVVYLAKEENGESTLTFKDKTFDISYAYYFSSGYSIEGTYTINGANITFNIPETTSSSDGPSDYYFEKQTWHGKISNNGKTITITDKKGYVTVYSLK